jgi:hypothetical protein
MRRFALKIIRKHVFSKSIVGELYANGEWICYTLELAWLWNETDKSCIPPGYYAGFIRYDKPDGWRIQLKSVRDPQGKLRTGIQIHMGGYPRHTTGCILVGTSYSPNEIKGTADAYQRLKNAFYADPRGTPVVASDISLQITGILATPFGDYPGVDESIGFT